MFPFDRCPTICIFNNSDNNNDNLALDCLVSVPEPSGVTIVHWTIYPLLDDVNLHVHVEG